MDDVDADDRARLSRPLRSDGFAQAGQTIVIAAGMPFGTPGSTNLLRIAQIDAPTWATTWHECHQQVRGFEILDSRGNPTVAAEVVLCQRRAGLCGIAFRRFHRLA